MYRGGPEAIAGNSRPWFTTETLAARLQVSERLIRKWVHEGRLRSHKIYGCRRFAPSDVDSFIAQFRVGVRGRTWSIADDPRPWFTPETLAGHLRTSERLIRNWVREARICSYKIGGCRRFDPVDVDHFVAQFRDDGEGRS